MRKNKINLFEVLKERFRMKKVKKVLFIFLALMLATGGGFVYAQTEGGSQESPNVSRSITTSRPGNENPRGTSSLTVSRGNQVNLARTRSSISPVSTSASWGEITSASTNGALAANNRAVSGPAIASRRTNVTYTARFEYRRVSTTRIIVLTNMTRSW
jgi:hypothetical protein